MSDATLAPELDGQARVTRAWAVLEGVPNPEVPVLSVCDLGIVRQVLARADGLAVALTPTYSGCPATEAIEQAVRKALDDAGLGPVAIETWLAPAWTTDWMSAAGREKLRAYGIAPPARRIDDADAQAGSGGAGVVTEAPLRFVPRRAPPEPALACPRCESRDTERLSAFGSTACKSLWRCRACGEPFDHFKAL